ncbi:MAG: hypothetical protein JXO22_00510, partial [Phycisphaerae bacterium]|nr:hypothetical protein [Phycisphaerae bacterium]
HGHIGTVFRASESANCGAAELEPITVPFEPAPLGTKPPDVGSAADAGGQQQNWRQIWEQIARTHGRSRFARAVSGILALLALVSIGWLFIEMLQQLTAGQVPDAVNLILYAAALLGIMLLIKLIRPCQWLAVPGGLVIRTSTWRSAKWQLHILRREESVLIYWVEANILAVAGGKGVRFTRRVSPAVADFAIRAWLSPLKPPAVEQLSDLV